jgi:hypothetical protein
MQVSTAIVSYFLPKNEVRLGAVDVWAGLDERRRARFRLLRSRFWLPPMGFWEVRRDEERRGGRCDDLSTGTSWCHRMIGWLGSLGDETTDFVGVVGHDAPAAPGSGAGLAVEEGAGPAPVAFETGDTGL